MFEIKTINANDTYELRKDVLNYPTIDECQYKGDLLEQTVHIGATKDEQIIGVASFYHETNKELKNRNMYRLKGLAIDPKHRNQLRGQTLLLFAENILRQKGVELIWCTTKLKNIDYYHHLGFKKVERLIQSPSKGLQVLMYKMI
ncbi:GNAT family N-acetyltransferase [Bacillus carboniphilus]|uniref:GNAT family N-acetyltransferase n=1 Tax=Bacillus carboniphilus TaxID=86663 RepID=A0ABY9JW50_9BACI|nr:GNAT family N-acetyltransferase [Bacillus carboniphilus]WLR43019.1 GNAT family N-acetyltransferase [Bacillus carboniphilus]